MPRNSAVSPSTIFNQLNQKTAAMKKTKKSILTIITMTCLLASSLLAGEGWSEGDRMPHLDSYGVGAGLPDIKGKVVYLDFWASWCAPCKASFPVIESWYQQLKGKGFLVLGINVDEKTSDMEAFLKKNPVSFPVLHDTSRNLVTAANVRAMPSSFLIDRNGVIRHIHSGFHKRDEAALLAQIQSLL